MNDAVICLKVTKVLYYQIRLLKSLYLSHEERVQHNFYQN